MAENILVCVKQGEELNIPMVIKSDGVPLDISGSTVRFIVKRVNQESAPPLFPIKNITETSNINTVGQITNPSVGELEVRINKSDTAFPPNDYYLVIFLDTGNQADIISADCGNSGLYRIDNQ